MFNPQLLEGIDIMIAVVDTKSFSGAAEILNMSQSGVSRAISRLEQRLSIRIFERTTRAVRLTDEGYNFYQKILPLISELEDITFNASSLVKKVYGRLRVNVDPLFSSHILGPNLEHFLDENPDLEIELRCKDSLGDLIGDGFDLALRFGHPQSSSLIARKLFETRVFAMASPGYLKKHGHPKHPAELESLTHRCIMFREPVSGKPFPWLFCSDDEKIIVKPKGEITVNDSGTVDSMCLAGLGIAQLFEFGTEKNINSNLLVNIFPDWNDNYFPLYAYYPSRHHVPAKTRALLDFVMTLVR